MSQSKSTGTNVSGIVCHFSPVPVVGGPLLSEAQTVLLHLVLSLQGPGHLGSAIKFYLIYFTVN